MSQPPTPVVVDSETESESYVESHPDTAFDYIIENQLGLPSPIRNQLYGNIQSTGVVDSETESESEVKSHSEEGFEYKIGNQLGLPPPVDTTKNELNSNTCEVKINANEGNEDEEMNTDIVVSWNNKKKTKINVHVEDSSRSKPAININIKQVQFRGEKHEREIEDVEDTTNIHIQVKKTRK